MPDWLTALRRYLVAMAVVNLGWETVQMPLYTLWRSGTAGEIGFAILHCTAGDAMIAAVALVGALCLFGVADWPRRRWLPVAVAAVAIGLTYTIHSERVNLARGAWAYAALMPRMPGLDIGLAPLLQWLLIPPACLAWACRRWGMGTAP